MVAQKYWAIEHCELKRCYYTVAHNFAQIWPISRTLSPSGSAVNL